MVLLSQFCFPTLLFTWMTPHKQYGTLFLVLFLVLFTSDVYQKKSIVNGWKFNFDLGIPLDKLQASSMEKLQNLQCRFFSLRNFVFFCTLEKINQRQKIGRSLTWEKLQVNSLMLIFGVSQRPWHENLKCLTDQMILNKNPRRSAIGPSHWSFSR